ncbi:MAG: hypothetical protein PVH03_02470 [Chloroflexota bacterium]|jgi:hypothetical protein
MQSQRTILILISLAIIIFAAGCLNPIKEEASPAPLAIAQQEPMRVGEAVQPLPPSLDKESDLKPEAFERVGEVLKIIATGRETLYLIEKYDIDIHFEPDGGSRFNPNTNQIVVDSKHDLYPAALILIHEVTHARIIHEGSAADVKADSREAFVQGKVAEEMEAVVSSIEAKMEFEQNGVNTSESTYTLEIPYRQAYWTATRTAKITDPGLGEEDLQSIGRAAGRAAVLQALLNGKAVTSNTQQTYPFYWGAEWDRLNDAT